MKKFIALEIGDSAYTEFKMKKSEEFKETNDGIYLGQYSARDEDEAYLELVNKYPEREFGLVVFKEMG